MDDILMSRLPVAGTALLLLALIRAATANSGRIGGAIW